MKFNIAHLDKTMLLQTLYRHASPKGDGETEYAQLLEAGEEVGNISAHECVKILRKAEKSAGDYIVDLLGPGFVHKSVIMTKACLT